MRRLVTLAILSVLLQGLLCTPSLASSLIYRPAHSTHVEYVDYTRCPNRKDLCDIVVNTCEQNYGMARSIMGVPDDWPTEKIRILLYRGVGSPTPGKNTICLNADYLHDQNNNAGAELWYLAMVFYRNLPAPKDGCFMPHWFMSGTANVLRASARGVPKDGWCAHCLPDYNHYDENCECGAAFLMYLDNKYKQAQPIVTVNKLVFKGEYTDAIWKELTGKNLEQLWQEYNSQQTAVKKRTVSPAAFRPKEVIYVAPECEADFFNSGQRSK